MLQQRRIRVDTANIVQGMYVAQLDCSWLTTPFVKRGFQIQSEDEIELLRKFCKHVYVDASQSAVSEQEILRANADSGEIDDPFSITQVRRRGRGKSAGKGGIRRLFGFLGGRGAAKEMSDQLTSLRAEAPQALDAYTAVGASMGEVIQRVKKHKKIDIDLLHNSIAPMVASVKRNPDALSWLGFLRKKEQGHFSYTITTAIWALIMGNEMGLTGRRLGNLAIGALLLDIGNTQIPRSIGLKDGELTESEREIMRMHVGYGLEIIKRSQGISDEIVAMVRYHHERLDGSGYPEGVGGDIPVYGRIAGVIDSFDAMISRRAYADQMCAYDAIFELNRQAGEQFQKEVVEQFIRALGMFPTGSLVVLNTGEVALVFGQNPNHRLRPRIIILLDADHRPLQRPKSIDLSRIPDRAGQKKALWITGGYKAGSFDIDPKDYFLRPQGNA